MVNSFSLKHLTAKKMIRGLILEKKFAAEEEGESSQTNASSGKGPEPGEINHAPIERALDVGGRHKSPEVRIDMPAEQHKSFEEAGKSVADRINEGGLGSLMISTFSDIPGPPWLRTAMHAAGLVAYVSTAAGYGMRAYNEKLSQILSKVGALAVSALVIASLTMPLPSAWAWIVGLVAWLITVISVLAN